MAKSLDSSRGTLRDSGRGVAVRDCARGQAARSAVRDSTRGLAAQLARYTVDARAQNFSPKTVNKMELGLKLFDEFMGGVADVRRVDGDDLRRFIVDLQQRTRWQGTSQASRGRLADETTRTYAQAVKVFWGWLAKKGSIAGNPLAEVPCPGWVESCPGPCQWRTKTLRRWREQERVTRRIQGRRQRPSLG